MRRSLSFISLIVGLGLTLGALWRATPAQAAGITGVSTIPSSTSVYVIANTDVGGLVYWCIVGYNTQKFFGGTTSSADCGLPTNELNRGWVEGSDVIGPNAKFTVPHLDPSQFYTIVLSQTNGRIPPYTYFTGSSVNVVTWPKLALTSGPTVTPPSPHVIGSTVPFAWDTNRVADSRVTYVGGALGWRTPVPGGATVFTDVAMVGNSVGLAAGYGGVLYRYFAASDQWLSSSSSTDDIVGADDLVSVAAGDTDTFWVGSRGGIFYSDDGGRFFERVHSVGFDFVDSLAAVGSNIAYASTSDGTMLKTTDAGTTWTPLIPPAPNRLTRIVAIDASRVWAAGWNGTIYRTDDGGTTWQNQSPGASGSFMDLFVVDSSNAVAVTVSGQIWRTTNAGTSWVLSQTNPETLYAVGMTSTSEGWAFAIDGKQYRTIDGWTTQTSAVVGTSDTIAAAVASSRHLITVGQNGFISDYGPNYAAGTTNFNSALDTSHAAAILNLPCQTSFFYRVGSDDGVSPNGSIVVSTDGVFTTGLCPDTDPPSVSFRARNLWTPPTPGTYTTNPTLTLRGDASDVAGGSGLATVSLTHSRGSPPVVTTVATDPALTVGSFAYAWQKTVTLERGVNTFSAHAVDVAGNPNLAPDPSVSVTFDGDDPRVTIDPPNNVNRTVSAASLTVSGTAADPMPGSGLASVTVRLNGTTVYTENYAGGPAAGTWTTAPPLTLLPNFANVIEVFATDVAGRTTTPVRSVTITYDSGGPTIANLTPVDNACTNTVPIPFTGQVTDPSGIGAINVTVNGTPVATNIVPGGFTANLAAPPLIKGSNAIVVQATDALGNPSTQNHSLRYDPDTPTARIDQPVDRSTVVVANQAVRGTVSDPNTPPATFSCGMLSLELSLNGGAYTPVNMAADPWTTVTLAPSIENTLQLRVTDSANNQFVSPVTRVTLDAAGPTNVEFTEVQGIPVPPLPPGPINVGVDTVSVRGTAQDDATLQTITVQRQGGPVIPVTAPPLPVNGSPATANWTGTIPNLQSGNNILVVTVTDNASHTTTDQIDVVYTPPDTTPPAVAPVGATSGTNCAIPPGVIFFDVSWTATDAESGVAQNTLRYRVQGSGNPWTTITQAAVPGPTQTVHVEPVTPNTNYEFEATSTDAAGRESAVLTFAARSADTCDTAGPTVVIEQPGNGDRVNDLVTITVQVTDTRGVKDVAFFIDGNPQGPPINCVDPLSPTDCRRTITWDTGSIVGPEDHTIRAVGRDTSDNAGQDEVTVTVDNSRPVITNVRNDPPVEAGGVWSVRVTWTTNVPADSAVHYSRERSDGGYLPYEDTEFDPVLDTSHEIILTNLQGDSIYHYQVESVDALGRRSQG